MIVKENISSRLKKIFEYKGFKKYSEFADFTGLSHQTASNYIKGKQKPDVEKLAIIQQSFEEINPVWLLTGTGDMLSKENDIQEKQSSNTSLNEEEISYESKKLYLEKDGIKLNIEEISLFVAKNEEVFMKKRIFSNIIEKAVAKRLLHITSSEENFIKYLKG